MYATAYGIRPLRSTRHAGLRHFRRLAAVIGLSLAVSVSLAVVAHGGTAPTEARVVVQPGDTIWSIAAERYPSDDVRARVEDIERLNRLSSPLITAGETLRVPA
ncbi:LysM peptidoglycan-binding domain-containing protein [bacterium]|nr:MAG: LysM peptidoglycan-binding domain-containing protein [bacterium]